MPLARNVCTMSSVSDPVFARLPLPGDLVSSVLRGALPGAGVGGLVTALLKGVTGVINDPESCGELEDFGPEIAADEAEEVETGPSEIWVVRHAKPVRLSVEDVPDPRGLLTRPGTPVPRVEEIAFPGLTLMGVRGFVECAEGFQEGLNEGRTGPLAEAGEGGETATHSSTSTYQAGGAGGAGTGSK
jgi:hypothetical protein